MGACLLLMACSDDSTESAAIAKDNKVLLLKVDAVTSAFEGGKELTFDEASSFTIEHEYNAPGDFGDIKLKYKELAAPLFEGTIHWMGLGAMNYPAIDPVDTFTTVSNNVALPAEALREVVQYLPSAMPLNEWPYAPDFEALWGAVDNLKLVSDYRRENPNAKVSFFLYTPSVGSGDPAQWDWFIILKN